MEKKIIHRTLYVGADGYEKEFSIIINSENIFYIIFEITPEDDSETDKIELITTKLETFKKAFVEFYKDIPVSIKGYDPEETAIIDAEKYFDYILTRNDYSKAELTEEFILEHLE